MFSSLEEFEGLGRQCENDVDNSKTQPPEHLQNHPSQKSLSHLNFESFDSQLDRLQQRCTCRSSQGWIFFRYLALLFRVPWDQPLEVLNPGSLDPLFGALRIHGWIHFVNLLQKLIQL